MGEIEERTARSMIADRDATIARKEKRISELRGENDELKKAAEGMSPLSVEESLVKKRMADFDEIVELIETRMKGGLGSLRLYDVIRNILDVIDMTRKERDRYASAWGLVNSAAKDAAVLVANGKP